MKIFQKLRCRLSGHPVPGVAGQFVAPVPFVQPEQNLPYLDSQCPRCGSSLKLYFLPGTQGMNTPAHAAALARWNRSQRGHAA